MTDKYPHKAEALKLIPRAVYACHDDRCAEEQSYLPEDLFLITIEGKPEGFYCDLCYDEIGYALDVQDEETGEITENVKVLYSLKELLEKDES